MANALSHYYESLSEEDLHYDDFMSVDIKINKNGDDLLLHHNEEAHELLFLHNIQRHTRFTQVSVSDIIEQHQLDTKAINPPYK